MCVSFLHDQFTSINEQKGFLVEEKKVYAAVSCQVMCDRRNITGFKKDFVQCHELKQETQAKIPVRHEQKFKAHRPCASVSQLERDL